MESKTELLAKQVQRAKPVYLLAFSGVKGHHYGNDLFDHCRVRDSTNYILATQWSRTHLASLESNFLKIDDSAMQ